MARLHQKKEVSKALEEAVALGFRIQQPGGSAHAGLILLCPHAAPAGHRMSVASTPRDEDNEARRIRRFVAKCDHWSRLPV